MGGETIRFDLTGVASEIRGTLRLFEDGQFSPHGNGLGMIDDTDAVLRQDSEFS
jgi:hypothetical protein